MVTSIVKPSSFLAGILITNPIHVRDGQSLEEFQEAMASSAYSNWEATLKTNVQAVYFTVVAFITLLGKAAEKGEGRGSVILTGSVGGFHQDKGVENLSYQSSKAYAML
jgi:NAD(P)-dependent dehydrogenase (short-subunit alcohol dehydrogenase family)